MNMMRLEEAIEAMMDNGGYVRFTAEADFSGYGWNEDLMPYDCTITMSNRVFYVEVELEDGWQYEEAFDFPMCESTSETIATLIEYMNSWMRKEFNNREYIDEDINANYHAN